jgi:predicted nuclease with TOPRIM domain
MINIDEYKEIKKKHEILKSKKDKAEGALDEILKRLSDEFDFDSIEEAEKQLSANKKQLEKIKMELESELEEFSKKWDEFENE